MTPTWIYKPFPGFVGPIAIEPIPGVILPPRRMAGLGPPDRWISEDLQLEVEAIDEESHVKGEEPPGTVKVFRWGRKQEPVFICYAGDGLSPRNVILALNEVRPQPSKPKDWEAAIKKAVKALT